MWLLLAPRPQLAGNTLSWWIGSSLLVLLSIVFYVPTPVPHMFSFSSVAWLHSLAIGLLLLSYWFIEDKPIFYSVLATAVLLIGLLFISRVPGFLRVGLLAFVLVLATGLGFLYYTSKNTEGSLQQVFLVTAAFVFGFLVLLQSAWLCDDAFITFRTVDNFLNGYGLRWNIAERVQTYTHPLYMFCLAGLTFLTHEFYYTVILFNIGLTCLALFLLIRYIVPTPFGAVLALIALSFSKAFVDYSTSGLENSLTFVFIAAFVAATRISFSSESKRQLALGLIAGLSTFNRLDTLLFFIPALGWLLWKTQPQARLRTLGRLALGFMPLLLWEIFSIIYYGFPFPNTAYAKLYLPFSTFAQMFNQGLAYFLNSLTLDPISLIVMALAVFMVFLSPAASGNIPLACGLLLYFAYVLKIGGDFMSGRFLAAPVFLGVLIFFSTFRLEKKHGIVLFFFVLTLSTITPFNPWHTNTDYHGIVVNRFVADERQFYYQATGLLRTKPGQTLNGAANHPTTLLRSAADFSKKTQRTTAHIAMGVLGFYSGPKVHMVDEVAVCDPLLARMPSWGREFYPGHMFRKIPGGYLQSINTDSNQLINPHLHQLYDALRLATRAPLFSLERFQAIVKLNTGAYNFSQRLTFFLEARPHRAFPLDFIDDPYFALIRQAREYRRTSDYLHIEDTLLQAQQLDPKRPEAKIDLGILYEYLGELDKAAQQFRYFADHKDAAWNKYYPELLHDMSKEAQP